MQLNPDTINGCFEFGGSIANLWSFRTLLKEKQISGVPWAPDIFFLFWEIWNLFYYPDLNQWFSMIGGAALLLTNIAWMILALKYRLSNNI